MARETWLHSLVESYQRLKKWYLMPPYLTLSIIRYGSRVKWSNPWKEVAPFPTPWCSSYRKGNLWVTLDYSRQLYYIYIYIYIYISFGKNSLIQTITLGIMVWSDIGYNSQTTLMGAVTSPRYSQNIIESILWLYF